MSVRAAPTASYCGTSHATLTKSPFVKLEALNAMLGAGAGPGAAAGSRPGAGAGSTARAAPAHPLAQSPKPKAAASSTQCALHTQRLRDSRGCREEECLYCTWWHLFQVAALHESCTPPLRSHVLAEHARPPRVRGAPPTTAAGRAMAVRTLGQKLQARQQPAYQHTLSRLGQQRSFRVRLKGAQLHCPHAMSTLLCMKHAAPCYIKYLRPANVRSVSSLHRCRTGSVLSWRATGAGFLWREASPRKGLRD